jgi:hypothetical protein
VIERQRGQHLAGDEQRDEGGRAKLRNQLDGKADEDRAE